MQSRSLIPTRCETRRYHPRGTYSFSVPHLWLLNLPLVQLLPAQVSAHLRLRQLCLWDQENEQGRFFRDPGLLDLVPDASLLSSSSSSS